MTYKIDNGIYHNIQINHENENCYKIPDQDENYFSLSEIFEKYLAPITNFIINVRKNKKYNKFESLLEFERQLLAEKKQDKDNIRKIYYYISFIPDYPSYLILGYTPKHNLVMFEYIKMRVNGFEFHNILFGDIDKLINYFRENFNSVQYNDFILKMKIPKGKAEELTKEIEITEFEGEDPNKLEEILISNGNENQSYQMEPKQQYEERNNRENNGFIRNKRNRNEENEQEGWNSNNNREPLVVNTWCVSSSE